jgi:uncharacterized SAM-binding protein YcdF (DUF218 family)
MTKFQLAGRRLYSARQCLAFAAAAVPARFSAIEPDGPVDGIIALGGEMARMVEALKLAHRYPNARVVASVHGDPYTQDFMRAHATLKGRLVLEEESRTTYENATVAARLVAPKPGERWMLVTSASHMPRAVGVFRKAGFNVYAWPIYYEHEKGRLSWRRAYHEWVGLVVYRLTGRMDALFPG